MEATFKTQSAEFAHLDGQHIKILSELDDKDRDPEVGRMFRIAFADGTEIDTFEDEIRKKVSVTT